MKNAGIISSLTILFIGFLLLYIYNSWQLKENLAPINKKPIPAKPSIPEPQKELDSEKVKKDSIHPDSIGITPIDSSDFDSTGIKIKDTIRSSQHLDQKIDMRFYRRIRQYNLHRKLPVS